MVGRMVGSPLELASRHPGRTRSSQGICSCLRLPLHSLGKKSPIIGPDPESKPAISRPYYSTLIPRGIHGDRKRPDKPITHPSRKNKPVIPPRQEEHLDRKFL